MIQLLDYLKADFALNFTRNKKIRHQCLTTIKVKISLYINSKYSSKSNMDKKEIIMVSKMQLK